MERIIIMLRRPVIINVLKSALLGMGLLLMSVLPAAAQSFTFAVDVVEPADKSIGWRLDGARLAESLHQEETNLFNSDWKPEILANSFAEEDYLFDIGEDVLFKMLLKAWCQHRPVVLTPDAVWMVITQGFSHYVNKHPEEMCDLLVSHEGKKELRIGTMDELFSSQADWERIIAGFTSEIDKYTVNDVATSLVADFSTTGINEKIASEVTLMDVVKPYFDYTVFYVVCGIPSITITGTPEDWRKVKQKTQALNAFGLEWWVSDLEPILDEFIKASEGNPNISFWKDIVKKTRPQTVQGPTCGKRQPKLTKFDGWFLKLFPFDNDGDTPKEVDITQTMLPETVCVPLRYEILAPDSTLIESHDLEIIAGIVGAQEDPKTFTLTPKIGWFVRTAKPSADSLAAQDNTGQNSDIFFGLNRDASMESSVRYWSDGALTLDDFSSRKGELPKILEFEYGIAWANGRQKIGNTVVVAPELRSYMNPYSSWIHPDYRNDVTLKYMQTAFDYVEVCRRRAKIETDKKVSNLAFSTDVLILGSPYMTDIPENIVKFHMGIADNFIAKLKDDTNQGQDTVALNYYSNRVAEELSLNEDTDPFDLKIKPKGFGIGMHAGIASEFYTGPLSAYATPIAGLDFGFDFVFSRINVYWRGLLGSGGRYKKDIALDGYKWYAGKKQTGGNLEVSLGYTAYESQWWKLVPFAGIGVGFIDYPENTVNPERDSDEISGFRFQAGLSADYKVFRFLSVPSLNEFSVRSKLYVAHTDFPYPAPAWSVNFGLCADVIAWIIK